MAHCLEILIIEIAVPGGRYYNTQNIGPSEVSLHEVVRALAYVVATKLCIIGANVVRARTRFPFEGRRSGH